MDEPRLTFTVVPQGWGIEGELDAHNTASLHAWCARVEGVSDPRILELAGLELLDAEAVTAAVAAVRQLVQRTPALIIHHAPHLLSHALYRLGMLEPGQRLTLVEPRQEEPYG